MVGSSGWNKGYVPMLRVVERTFKTTEIVLHAIEITLEGSVEVGMEGAPKKPLHA